MNGTSASPSRDAARSKPKDKRLGSFRMENYANESAHHFVYSRRKGVSVRFSISPKCKTATNTQAKATLGSILLKEAIATDDEAILLYFITSRHENARLHAQRSRA
jgi:hypothetical protein